MTTAMHHDGATTEPKPVAVVKAEEKRKRKKARNLKHANHDRKTKGAFGKPAIMRRNRE